MFICQHCGVQVRPHQPVNRTVTEKRQKTYLNEASRPQSEEGHYNIRDNSSNIPVTTTGWEIVKEEDVCPKCYLALTGKEPAVYTEVSKSPHKFKGPVKSLTRKLPVVEVVNPTRIVKD